MTILDIIVFAAMIGSIIGIISILKPKKSQPRPRAPTMRVINPEVSRKYLN